MTNHERAGNTYYDQLLHRVGSLVTEHTGMVVQHHEVDKVYYPRLCLAAVVQPDTTVARIEPYVIDAPTGFFRLEHDDQAELDAEPYSRNREALKEVISGRPKDVLWLPRDKKHGSSSVVESIRDNKTVRRQLPPNDTTLNVWLDIMNAAGVYTQLEAYNRETHGILRHDLLPDGRRAGPDSIAPWHEVDEHQRLVELSHMGRARRFWARYFG